MQNVARSCFLFVVFSLSCRPQPLVEQSKESKQPPRQEINGAAQRSTPLLQKELSPANVEPRTFLFKTDFDQLQQSRQLKSLSTIDAEVLTSEELSHYVHTLIERDHQPAEYEHETHLLKALELLPWSLDRKATELSLLGQELNGLYDPKDKKFVIRDSLSPEMKKLTIFHELTHALQDQHFNLEKALEVKKNTSDSRAALHSLAEGDALLTMVKAAYEENDAEFYLESLQPLHALYSSIPQTQQHSKIPPLLMLAALAPYRDGLRFVEYLFKKGGISALNTAWLAPPTTTQQLLHPSHYEARTNALQISARKAPTDYTKVYDDALGEQGLRIIAEVWTSAQKAELIASGWNGDRIALYQNSQQEEKRKDSTAALFVIWEIAVGLSNQRKAIKRLFEQGLGKATLRSKSTHLVQCGQTKNLLSPFVSIENQGRVLLVLGPVQPDISTEAHLIHSAQFSKKCAELLKFTTTL